MHGRTEACSAQPHRRYIAQPHRGVQCTTAQRRAVHSHTEVCSAQPHRGVQAQPHRGVQDTATHVHGGTRKEVSNTRETRAKHASDGQDVCQREKRDKTQSHTR